MAQSDWANVFLDRYLNQKDFIFSTLWMASKYLRKFLVWVTRVVLVVLCGFNGISTFVSYLTTNPFLYKQFSLVSIYFFLSQSNVKIVLSQTIKFSLSIVLMSKAVLFETIQFSISTQFKYPNSSTSSNSVQLKCAI